MNKISGIYVIYGPKDKLYIGSAVNIYGRWSLHKHQLRSNKHGNIYLQRAWNKYGEQAFIFSLLEACRVSDLLNREQYYLDSIERTKLYNIAAIAGSSLGIKRSSEHTEKVRRANLGTIKRRGYFHGKRKFVFVNPEGKTLHIDNLNEFCIKNNLDTSSMVKVSKGNRKSHKGYTKQ